MTPTTTTSGWRGISRSSISRAQSYGSDASFIQLDDFKADKLPALAPAVFLMLETSSGNFQAWVTLPGPENREFARQLRKDAGADPTASGATRVAGSLNFKNKYAPNFPRVAIHTAQPARLTSMQELEQLGLVVPPEPATVRPQAPSPTRRGRPGPGARKWPSYELCLERAPPSQGSPGENRQSTADFTWCLIAASWEWSRDEIAQQLMEVSAKARDNGPVYALKTATRAAEAAQRNGVAAARRHGLRKQQIGKPGRP